VALNPTENQKKAEALSIIIQELPIFVKSQHIAFYWPQRGEISPLSLLATAIQLKKKCYLPVLDPHIQAHLLFAPYQSQDPLTPNRFNILEPRLIESDIIPAADLDLVLTPLVAFDLSGRRLGMGGGYYDHTFAFLKQTPRPSRPYLLGLGHAFQQVERLPEDNWDVLLNGVATEEEVHDALLVDEI